MVLTANRTIITQTTKAGILLLINIMADKIYVQGVKLFNKTDKQPDFVLGAMIITLDDLQAMFKEQAAHTTEYNGKKQLKFQLKKSQEGSMYAELDTWKKDGAARRR